MQPSLPRKPLLDLALKQRLPLVGSTKLASRDGFLLSYSYNQNDLYRRAAFYIDGILKGAKPADLPVEQPTRFELIVNLKAANARSTRQPTGQARRAPVLLLTTRCN